MRARTLFLILCLAALRPAAALAQAAGQEPDLSRLSIEELMAIDVTSASRRDEQLFRVPAAVFVITQEDLRRSGALSIPDALRMVPGMDVAQIDANTWQVSARGFNERFANKLLVMIDGRIVYTHIFSGVYWDTQDLVLEDIDRIEVIRGPGATLWGANAVNGVINIITKHTRETQGGLLAGGGGNLETGFGEARYGGTVGADTTYRVFGKAFSRSHNDTASGGAGADGWDSRMAGARAEWTSGPDSATLSGQVYRVTAGERDTELVSLDSPLPVTGQRHNTFDGANATLAWTHSFSPTSSIEVNAIYDGRDRDETIRTANEHIVDLSFQHNWSPGRSQQIVWGLGYRRTTDDLTGIFPVSFVPMRGKQSLVSAFLQDDVTLVERRLHAILGSKLESYDGHSPQYQPNFRFLWTPSERQTVWGSLARALRTPSRAETGVEFAVAAFPGDSGPINVVSVVGNPDVRPERLMAYELGYRVQPTDRVSFDLATFSNRYDQLLIERQDPPFFDPAPESHVVVPLRIVNGGSGQTYGAEVAANWNAAPWWRLKSALTWLEVSLTAPSAAAPAFGPGPRFQANLRSSIDLARHFGVDVAAYYVGRNAFEGVGEATRVDVVASWQPLTVLELSLVAHNLFDHRQVEVGPALDGLQTTAAPRSVYGKVLWRF